MLKYKKRIWALLVCTLTALSLPIFCVENQPVQSTAPQTAPMPEKPSQEEIENLKSLQQAADQGDKTAQLELGIVYVNGDDLDQDFDKAAHWLLKSAKQGEYHAMTSLMLLAREPSLSPATKSKVEAWLKAQGDQLPKLDFSPPASTEP
jgi:hypothetical protein